LTFENKYAVGTIPNPIAKS